MDLADNGAPKASLEPRGGTNLIILSPGRARAFYIGT